jgi:hypothetical protein
MKGSNFYQEFENKQGKMESQCSDVNSLGRISRPVTVISHFWSLGFSFLVYHDEVDGGGGKACSVDFFLALSASDALRQYLCSFGSLWCVLTVRRSRT